jgi:hypothetical protein
VRPVSAHTHISAPREEVFDFVADLANHVAYIDHYVTQFRLARVESRGVGAAARFRIDAPGAKPWVEVQVVESDRPRRIVEEGRTGRVGRTRTGTVYEFSGVGSGVTRVDLTSWTEPGALVDRLRESLGARGWLKRQQRVALERLRMVFEQPAERPLMRTTIAGYEPGTAPRYGG